MKRISTTIYNWMNVKFWIFPGKILGRYLVYTEDEKEYIFGSFIFSIPHKKIISVAWHYGGEEKCIVYFVGGGGEMEVEGKRTLEIPRRRWGIILNMP